MEEQKDKQDMWRAIAVASGAGFTMLSTVATFMYLGYKLDHVLGFRFPIGVFGGGLIGAVIGFLAIYEQVVRK